MTLYLIADKYYLGADVLHLLMSLCFDWSYRKRLFRPPLLRVPVSSFAIHLFPSLLEDYAPYNPYWQFRSTYERQGRPHQMGDQDLTWHLVRTDGPFTPRYNNVLYRVGAAKDGDAYTSVMSAQPEKARFDCLVGECRANTCMRCWVSKAV